MKNNHFIIQPNACQGKRKSCIQSSGVISLASSFLLRDENGRIGGYVVCGDQGIRSRLSGAPAQRTLRLRFEQETRDYAIFRGGDEQLIDSDRGQVISACVMEGGSVCLASDWRKACLKTEENAPVKHTGVPEEIDDSANETAAEGTHNDGSDSEGRNLPERRWPPPCCMRAEYVQGQWRVKA